MIARNRNRRELHPRPPPREWLLRLVDAQATHGAKWSHASVKHQAGCGVSRGLPCDCKPDVSIILKCGRTIAV